IIALVTSRSWRAPAAVAGRGKSLRGVALTTTIFIYLQLALGASMRHQHRDLAITDFPTAYGQWIPDTSAAAIAKINAARDTIAMSDVTAVQIWLQMAHRFGAVLVAIGVIWFFVSAHREKISPLRGLSTAWLIGVLLQFTLGAWTIWSNKAADVATALNQWWERDLDALMSRTRTRPLHSGRMLAGSALILGCFMALTGIVYLALTTNFLATLLTALTVVIYILAYTPLKGVTTTNTLVGAIPGALPPLIGWAAARDSLNFGAWTLFAIVFIWQMPHFFAIAWLCRRDYERAGFRMLSSDDVTGVRSANLAVLFW